MTLRHGFCQLVFLCAASFGMAAEPSFFAMDTGTKDATHQTADSQVTLVKEIGFSGIGPELGTPDALREMLTATDHHQVKFSALYMRLDLESGLPAQGNLTIPDVMQQLHDRGAILWLSVTSKTYKPSDPAGDARAVQVLRDIAALAKPAGVRVALYPHAGFWVGRIEDAMRIANQVDQPNLGVTFNLCHWLKVDGKDLDARLELARPRLFVVTLNGADTGVDDWGHLIQPLGSGNFDTAHLLAKLKDIGFTGPIGLQHYGIPGDARTNLQRSMDAWRTLHGDKPKESGTPPPTKTGS